MAIASVPRLVPWDGHRGFDRTHVRARGRVSNCLHLAHVLHTFLHFGCIVDQRCNHSFIYSWIELSQILAGASQALIEYVYKIIVVIFEKRHSRRLRYAAAQRTENPSCNFDESLLN